MERFQLLIFPESLLLGLAQVIESMQTRGGNIDFLKNRL